MQYARPSNSHDEGNRPVSRERLSALPHERVSQPAASVGTRPAVIDGRYALREVLGTGGMGIVYLARRIEDGVPVALKVLRSEYAADARINERFRREAAALRLVQHENIVQLLDDGDAKGIGPYLVFEHLEGECLTERMNSTRGLPLEEVLDIADQLLAAIAAAHAVGVIHRDLKPENVFLLPPVDGIGPGQVKVLDFGIARMLEDGASQATRKLTRTGTIVGTPIYMSPEQAMGESTQDERVDVYAAGVLLYEMISGAVPHDGENYGQILAHVLGGTPIPLELHVPGIDARLAEIVHRAFARDLNARFSSANELREALAGWRRGDVLERARVTEVPDSPDGESETAVRELTAPSMSAASLGESDARRAKPARWQQFLAAGLAASVFVLGSIARAPAAIAPTTHRWALDAHFARAIAQNVQRVQLASHPHESTDAPIARARDAGSRPRAATAPRASVSDRTASLAAPLHLVTNNPYRAP